MGGGDGPSAQPKSGWACVLDQLGGADVGSRLCNQIGGREHRDKLIEQIWLVDEQSGEEGTRRPLESRR